MEKKTSKKSSKKVSPKVPAKTNVPVLIKGDVVTLRNIGAKSDIHGFVRRADVAMAYIYVPGVDRDIPIALDHAPFLIESGGLEVHERIEHANVLHVTVVADELFFPRHVIVRDSSTQYLLAKPEQVGDNMQYLLDEAIRARLLIDSM